LTLQETENKSGLTEARFPMLVKNKRFEAGGCISWVVTPSNYIFRSGI
jgi:hypothetical protein